MCSHWASPLLCLFKKITTRVTNAKCLSSYLEKTMLQEQLEGQIWVWNLWTLKVPWWNEFQLTFIANNTLPHWLVHKTRRLILAYSSSLRLKVHTWWWFSYCESPAVAPSCHVTTVFSGLSTSYKATRITRLTLVLFNPKSPHKGLSPSMVSSFYQSMSIEFLHEFHRKPTQAIASDKERPILTRLVPFFFLLEFLSYSL